MADAMGDGAGLATVRLEDELAQVHSILQGSADELRSPLGDLVRVQAEAARPLVRGAMVLAAAYRPPDTAGDRARRVALASALEMLHIALGIHGLLLITEAADADLDKSLIGSTILAGDYCFSRAAQLAAQTDSPQVVAIFSEALKDISELQLRNLFGSLAGPDDRASVLVRSGILGAALLSQLTPGETSAVLAAGLGLIEGATSPVAMAEVETLLDSLPRFQRAAWAGLIAWLAAELDATGNWRPAIPRRALIR